MCKDQGSQDSVGRGSVIINTNDMSNAHFPEFTTDTKSLSCNWAPVEVHLTEYG